MLYLINEIKVPYSLTKFDSLRIKIRNIGMYQYLKNLLCKEFYQLSNSFKKIVFFSDYKYFFRFIYNILFQV